MGTDVHLEHRRADPGSGTVCSASSRWRTTRASTRTARRKSVLSTVAAGMGMALENARLFDETQRRTRETARWPRSDATFLHARLAKVMDRIAHHAKDLLHGDNSAIFLRGRGRHELRRRSSRSAQCGSRSRRRSSSRRVGHHRRHPGRGRPSTSTTPDADPRAIQIPGTEKTENERLMVVPLLAGAAVKGAMAVWRTGGVRSTTPSSSSWRACRCRR